MYITSNRSQTGYTASGQQRAGGLFLILFSEGRELRGVVRSVQLRQLGHFMMGAAKIGGVEVGLSGASGHDGLPLDPDRHPGIWESLVPLPADLAEQFWKGGGHNSSGNEAVAVRRWAKAHLDELQKAARTPPKKSTQKRRGPKPSLQTTRQRRIARKAASKGVALKPAQIRRAASNMGLKYPEGLERRAKDLADHRSAGWLEYDAKNRESEWYHGPNFDPRNKSQAWEHERFMALPKPRLPNPSRTEQEETDLLERLAGGPYYARHMENLWTRIGQSHSGDRYNIHSNNDPDKQVKSFVRRAREDGYSDAAIKQYITGIIGASIPRGLLPAKKTTARSRGK